MNKVLYAIIWFILASIIYFLVNSFYNRNTAEQLGEETTVTLDRDRDGHYRAEAFINGKKMNVLIDTGATGVVISQSAADQLGLESNSAIRTTTANGDSVGYTVRLDSIKLGGIETDDVYAIIAPNLGGEVLLGMSFLSRMDVRLFQGQMTITQVE